MNKSYITALFLVLLATQAMAAITVTINQPAAGTVLNNKWQTALDINFSGTDNNTATYWRYFDINYYSNRTHPDNGTAIVSDANMVDWNKTRTSAQSCVMDGNGATFSCHYTWTIPTNPTMGDGYYLINIHVFDLNGSNTKLGINYEAGTHITADKNATTNFTVQTHLTSAQSIRDIMTIVGLLFAAGIIVAGLFAMLVLKTNPTTTVIVMIVGAIAAAIGAQIIGTVLSTL